MWNDEDEDVRRGMARAVKSAWGLALAEHDGRWVIEIGAAGSKSIRGQNEMVDLVNGLCFRR